MPLSATPRGEIVALNKRAGIFLIAIDDGIGAHVSERLDGERGIEAAHRWKGRAADDEEIGDIPTLALAVDDRSLWIATHARAAFVVGAGHSGAGRRTPDVLRARGAAEFLQFVHQEVEARNLIWPAPIIGEARGR